MKTLFIVANWKSYKSVQQTKEWFDGMAALTLSTPETKEVVVCAPFTLLPTAKESTSPEIKIGGQDVSPFGEGAYTGEIHGKQLKEFADYVIIGHSERRMNFGEDDALLAKKVEQALAAGLTPIFCVQGKETPVPKGVTIVAYEPVSAIGTGNPDTPENANEVCATIKKTTGVPYVLYGGSVKGENVSSFTSKDGIDGVLVGGASLEPKKFADIITNA